MLVTVLWLVGKLSVMGKSTPLHVECRAESQYSRVEESPLECLVEHIVDGFRSLYIQSDEASSEFGSMLNCLSNKQQTHKRLQKGGGPNLEGVGLVNNRHSTE